MSTTALLVVDVQPAYHPWCRSIARQVSQRINNTVKPTFVMWVGEGVTSDSEESVFDYLREHGARRGKLEQATFIEKDYGFFRGWMDNGVSRETIIKAGRQMLSQGRYSTEDLDLSAYLTEDEHAEVSELRDYLLAPSFASSRLQYFRSFETCGGGQDECLAEVELYLEMKNYDFRRLPTLVY